MRRLLTLTGFVFAVVTIHVAPAHAEHACRQEARELHKAALGASDVDEFVSLAQDALGDHPECAAEFEELVGWYAAGGEGAFPLAAADDPKHNFLGPIGWWWNTVFIDWFGRSVLMMFLFGWEIFLAPIALALGVLNAAFGAIREGARAGV